MIGIIGILISIAALIILVYMKVKPIYCAVIASLIAGLTNGLPFWDILGKYFATGMTNFFATVMFIFILAAIYGRMMGDTGNATAIAYQMIKWFGKDKVVLVVGLSTALLVYGGVSSVVVVFAIYPIGVILLREANISKTILPGIIAYGAITFAMTALPGSPQLNNIIPSQILGTSPMAAPILGIVAALVLGICGYFYLIDQIKKMRKKGIGFDPSTVKQTNLNELKEEDCPPVLHAFLPMVVLMVIYLSLSNGWFGLKMPTYNAINTAMIISIVLIFMLNTSRIKLLLKSLADSSTEWIMPLINLTVIIGFGVVVKNTAGFAKFVQFALNIPGPIYLSAAISTDIIAGITGSASGGITIALDSLAKSWLAAGANPEVLHRICSVASGCLDSLPHAGGLFTIFAVCNETHKSGYKHVFWVSVLIPTLATAVIVVLASFGVV